VLPGCGKVGDPVPPIPRAPLTVSELDVRQEGDRLVLTFPLARPARAEQLGRIDLYRLIEPGDAPPGLPPEEFGNRSTIIASIPAEELPAGQSPTLVVTYQDALARDGGPPRPRYRYAVRLVNRSGQAADFSNYAVITPLIEVAAPPTDLRVRAAETELVITWSPPAANEGGTQPANVGGYNLYRRAGGGPPARLNAEPLREPSFVDRGFQFGTSYEYTARSLSLPPGTRDPAAAIESNESAPAAITPRDVFPPTAPTPVTVASINGVVSLFWPANPEADVAGYHLYRSDDGKAPDAAWVKINARLQTATSFRDDRVQIGKQYFYRLTAVDSAGNESPRSETVSEVVNP